MCVLNGLSYVLIIVSYACVDFFNLIFVVFDIDVLYGLIVFVCVN